MRTVGIWIGSLLASAIPFVFVGAVIVFVACVFDAEGEHAPTARSGASFQGEAQPATPERALIVADTPDDVAQRRSDANAHPDHRDHRAHVAKQWKRRNESTRSRRHVRFARSYSEHAYWPRSREWLARSTSWRW
jgi:hypothetical protein